MHWLAIALSTLALSIAPLTPGLRAQAQTPTLTVSAPTNGAVMQGTTVTVVFQTGGIQLVPTPVPLEEAGKRPEFNRPGEGHVHFVLDLQPLVVWERGEPYTFTNVPAGTHQLMVEVVENDHASFSPPVMQTIRFRTESTAQAPAQMSVPVSQAPMSAELPRGGEAPWPPPHAQLLGLLALALLAGGLGCRRGRRSGPRAGE